MRGVTRTSAAARRLACAIGLALFAAGACGAERAPDAGAAAPPDAGPPAQREVRVYFTRDEQPVPVERRVPADAPLRGALRALLAGPTAAERAAGLESWFGEPTAQMLRGVTIGADGVAIIDFDDFSGIIPNASTSAGSAMLLGELNHTVFQFPEIAAVEYRLAGSCDAFWNWLQRGCGTIRRGQHTGL
jgi:hypothetical protein